MKLELCTWSKWLGEDLLVVEAGIFHDDDVQLQVEVVELLKKKKSTKCNHVPEVTLQSDMPKLKSGCRSYDQLFESKTNLTRRNNFVR